MEKVIDESILRDTFGVKEFRPGQQEVLQAVVRGQDAFARMPTGHGKSLCFQYPAAAAEAGEGATLVVSPLIALMRDQVRSLVERGISATDLNSSCGETERDVIMRNLRGGLYRLFYVAPEQLGSASFAEQTAGAGFSRIVVDEAHCISQWGHDFRPSYSRIRAFADERGIRQRIAFTATASKNIAQEVEASLGMQAPFEYFGDLLRSNLRYEVRRCGGIKEKADHIYKLIKEHVGQPGGILIYCATRKDVVAIYDWLKRKNFPVCYYHGTMPDSERKASEADFFNNNKEIMVATNAFGMGVDKQDIRLIIHLHMPGTIEHYLQESGRAGRDGQPALCVLLHDPADKRLQERFLQQNAVTLNQTKAVYRTLEGQRKLQGIPTDGEFTVNFASLKYRCSAIFRGIYSSDSSVGTAMRTLEEFGILEIRGAIAKLAAFRNEGAIEDYIRHRLEIGRTKLNRTLEYAGHGNPSQELLIKLLEEGTENHRD